MKLSEDQGRVLTGMVGAALFSIAFVFAGAHWSPFQPTVATAGERVAFALRCDFFAALALLAGVARVAMQRFFSEAIDGTLPPRGRSLEVNRAYIQNTSEQLLLALVAHASLALVVEPDSLGVIPVLVALFLIGRLAFWLGYLRSAPARAFGFATTFYPTVAVYVYVALRLAM